MTTARSIPTHELPLRPFTADEYFQLAEIGVLHNGDRLELIEGRIVMMSSMVDPHHGAIMALIGAVRYERGFVFTVQTTLRLSDETVVDPDMMVLRPKARPKGGLHPEDVILLVEVSDSSLRPDRDIKLPLYARAGIPEYWIVDTESRTVLC